MADTCNKHEGKEKIAYKTIVRINHDTMQLRRFRRRRGVNINLNRL
jgi:hypothetical protein